MGNNKLKEYAVSFSVTAYFFVLFPGDPAAMFLRDLFPPAVVYKTALFTKFSE